MTDLEFVLVEVEEDPVFIVGEDEHVVPTWGKEARPSFEKELCWRNKHFVGTKNDANGTGIADPIADPMKCDVRTVDLVAFDTADGCRVEPITLAVVVPRLLALLEDRHVC